LALSVDLGSATLEAQSCYSLGNTYALLRNHSLALEFHSRHLAIAQQLKDKIGESRAYWSIGNAHSSLGDHVTALKFAKLHLAVATEIGDTKSKAVAELNLRDLQKVVDDRTGKSTFLVGDWQVKS